MEDARIGIDCRSVVLQFSNGIYYQMPIDFYSLYNMEKRNLLICVLLALAWTTVQRSSMITRHLQLDSNVTVPDPILDNAYFTDRYANISKENSAIASDLRAMLRSFTTLSEESRNHTIDALAQRLEQQSDAQNDCSAQRTNSTGLSSEQVSAIDTFNTQVRTKTALLQSDLGSLLEGNAPQETNAYKGSAFNLPPLTSISDPVQPTPSPVAI